MPTPQLAQAVLQALELRAHQRRVLRHPASLSTSNTLSAQSSAAPTVVPPASAEAPAAEAQPQPVVQEAPAPLLLPAADRPRASSLGHARSLRLPHESSHLGLSSQAPSQAPSEPESDEGSIKSTDMALDWVVVQDTLEEQNLSFDNQPSLSELRHKSQSTVSLDDAGMVRAISLGPSPRKHEPRAHLPKPGYIAIPPLPPRLCRVSVQRLNMKLLRAQLDGFVEFGRDGEPAPMPFPIQLDVRMHCW